MSTVPTWPGVCAVSRASNETSRGVSRCGMRALPAWNSWSHYGTTANCRPPLAEAGRAGQGTWFAPASYRIGWTRGGAARGHGALSRSLDTLVDHGALREAGTNEHRRP